MCESINDWVERLSAKPLPVMQHTLTRVSNLLNKPNANHRALCDIVVLDPGFSLYVFQSINALPKRPREPISKLSNAISLLGLKHSKRPLETSRSWRRHLQVHPGLA